MGGLLLPTMPFALTIWILVILTYIGTVVGLTATQNFGVSYRRKFRQDNAVSVRAIKPNFV